MSKLELNPEKYGDCNWLNEKVRNLFVAISIDKSSEATEELKRKYPMPSSYELHILQDEIFEAFFNLGALTTDIGQNK